jgi:hypothetical protein
MNHRHTTAVRLALIALMALAGGPAAAVTIIVENIHGFVGVSWYDRGRLNPLMGQLTPTLS